MPVFNVFQIGPGLVGFMNNTGAGSGSVMVCTGSPAGWGFPDRNTEYWFFPSGLPNQNWSSLEGSGAVPTYASHQGSWRACPNAPFGASQDFAVTIDSNDEIYAVACTGDGKPIPTTFLMFVKNQPGGAVMGWIAEDLPSTEDYLFPTGAAHPYAMAFTRLPRGTYNYTSVRLCISPLVTV